eukprot:3006813-Rhodomonas_salina.1
MLLCSIFYCPIVYCYAVCGTELAYAATPPCKTRGTDPAYGATSCPVLSERMVLRSPYKTRGTDGAYGARGGNLSSASPPCFRRGGGGSAWVRSPYLPYAAYL